MLGEGDENANPSAPAHPQKQPPKPRRSASEAAAAAESRRRIRGLAPSPSLAKSAHHWPAYPACQPRLAAAQAAAQRGQLHLQPPSCYPPAAYPHYPQQMAAGYWEAEPPPPPFADPRGASSPGREQPFSPLKDTDGPSATPLLDRSAQAVRAFADGIGAHTAAHAVCDGGGSEGAAAAAAEGRMRSARPPPGAANPSRPEDGYTSAPSSVRHGLCPRGSMHGPPWGHPPLRT